MSIDLVTRDIGQIQSLDLYPSSTERQIEEGGGGCSREGNKGVERRDRSGWLGSAFTGFTLLALFFLK